MKPWYIIFFIIGSTTFANNNHYIYENFSNNVKNYIQFLSHQLGVPISIISIGPRRNQIIHIET